MSLTDSPPVMVDDSPPDDGVLSCPHFISGRLSSLKKRILPLPQILAFNLNIKNVSV